MLRGTKRQSVAKVAPYHKYMWTLRRLGCGMPFDAARPKNSIGKLSVPSKEAARHMMNKGFQNGFSQFEKKITPSLPISFHSFGNLKKVCKKFFFHVDMIALAAYAEQISPHSKAAVCCILLRSIVWMHLKDVLLTLHGMSYNTSKVLRTIAGTAWYILNDMLHNDLRIWLPNDNQKNPRTRLKSNP